MRRVDADDAVGDAALLDRLPDVLGDVADLEPGLSPYLMLGLEDLHFDGYPPHLTAMHPLARARTF